MKKITFSFLSFLVLLTTIGTHKIEASSNNKLSLVELSLLEEVYNGEFDVSPDDMGEIISVSKIEKTFYPDNNADERATISPAKMDLYTTVSLHSSNSTRFVYKVTVIANWKDSPVWLFNDVIAASWGNNLALENRSLSMRYSSGATENKTTLYKSTPNKGAAFEVPMKNGIEGYLTSATANFYISHPKAGAPRTNIASGYAHKKIALGSFGIELNSSTSIGFSLSGAFDSAHDSIVFGS